VKAVHQDRVDFNVQPLSLNLSARLHQTVSFDKLASGRPAVAVTVLKTDSSKTATLQVRLLHDELAASTKPVSSKLQFILLIFITILLVTLRYWSNRFGMAKRS
jgi:hypothetical protein